MMNWIVSCCKNLWFRDLNEENPYINDVAMRIRAGFLLAIPMYMGLTCYTVMFGSPWVVTGDIISDTLETDFDGRIIYSVEAVRLTFDYTLQTVVLCYALFEMLAGMSVKTARLSPTILLSSFLAKGAKPVWKPLVPKRFAWSIGASFILVCLVFFNPDVLAGWVNAVVGYELLPATRNYIPSWVALSLAWTCFVFMWMEAVLGFCAGCKVHALLVWMGVLEEECEACNNLDWGDTASKNQQHP